MDIEKFFDNRRTQFWALQIIGWTGWGVTFYLAAVIWGSPGSYARYVPIICAMGLLLTLGLRVIYRLSWDLSLGRRLVITIVASYLAAAAWRVSRVFLVAPLVLEGGTWVKHERMMAVLSTPWDHLFYRLEGGTSAWMVMLCWSGLYFGIKYYHLLQEERQRGLKSEAMAHEAQLKMLRYQLNPHFLFNTLNAISTLILDKQNELLAGQRPDGESDAGAGNRGHEAVPGY